METRCVICKAPLPFAPDLHELACVKIEAGLLGLRLRQDMESLADQLATPETPFPESPTPPDRGKGWGPSWRG